MMRKVHVVRNVAVIAHVDHGKTTLSDHLLTRAQVLNALKAGAARALDTDAEEQERGITIHSTGISLTFNDVDARLRIPSDEDDETSSDTLYIGNLPFVRPDAASVTADDLFEALETALAQYADGTNGFKITLNAKRSFAMVKFASVDLAAAVLTAVTAKPITLGERVVSCEYANQGSVQMLAAFAQEQGLEAPKYEVHPEGDGYGGHVLVNGQQHPVPVQSTRRGVRHAAAAQALRTLTSANQTALPLQLNLIDSPGHVDFSAEVTAALRICDGALVIVDCIEGVGVQTKTVLRQALADGVQPVLVMNKVDRCMGELNYSPEEAYLKFESTIAAINALIEQYQPADVDFRVTPRNGSVGFASGLHGWGFTLPQIAERLLQRQGQAVTEDAMLKLSKRLWGSYYVDSKTHKWRKDYLADENGQAQERVFCKFVLQPLYEVVAAEKQGEVEPLLSLAAKRGLSLKKSQTDDLSPKALRKLILRTWLPVADAMLYMINHRLPSPPEAQVRRLRQVYLGDNDDAGGQAIAKCNAGNDAPLVMYVSKMVPNPGKNAKGSIAFGRVFSGQVSAGDKVVVLHPDSSPDDVRVEATAVVKSVVKVNATKLETVAQGVAGDVVGLTGLDGAILKCGTVTMEPVKVYPIKSMHFSVSPVVRVAVRTAKPGDSAKLQQAMRQLQQQDPIVQCHYDKATGESIVAGVGELHVEVSVKTLAAIAKCEIVTDEPVVSYSETVAGESAECLAKSSNKHNRLFVEAARCPEALVQALERKEIDFAQSLVPRTQAIVEATGWDRNIARKVLAIEGTNVLLDAAVGVDLAAAKDMIIMGFKEVCAQGPVCGEPLQAVVVKITNAKLHPDSVHRRIDQILPMARSVFRGAVLAAQPALLEPIFQVDIQVPASGLAATRKVLKQRRGQIKEDNTNFETGLHDVRACLPVAESFGFSGDLVGATSGQAFPSASFSHWEVRTGFACGEFAELTIVILLAAGWRRDDGRQRCAAAGHRHSSAKEDEGFCALDRRLPGPVVGVVVLV
eukprot:TRINITY_DN11687_c0_g1_i5.p1 TRINITY_DN11687_c0_g1~~TRINITY_DN11687_c0_g1_i5.p1  ORF type:complete len:1024 (+),score=315.78 TRINITY_DN11687_c0_g1_i5:209-3280(+)